MLTARARSAGAGGASATYRLADATLGTGRDRTERAAERAAWRRGQLLTRARLAFSRLTGGHRIFDFWPNWAFLLVAAAPDSSGATMRDVCAAARRAESDVSKRPEIAAVGDRSGEEVGAGGE